jgi:hypothetical protein
LFIKDLMITIFEFKKLYDNHIKIFKFTEIEFLYYYPRAKLKICILC